MTTDIKLVILRNYIFTNLLYGRESEETRKAREEREAIERKSLMDKINSDETLTKIHDELKDMPDHYRRSLIAGVSAYTGVNFFLSENCLPYDYTTNFKDKPRKNKLYNILGYGWIGISSGVELQLSGKNYFSLNSLGTNQDTTKKLVGEEYIDEVYRRLILDALVWEKTTSSQFQSYSGALYESPFHLDNSESFVAEGEEYINEVLTYVENSDIFKSLELPKDSLSNITRNKKMPEGLRKVLTDWIEKLQAEDTE